MEEKEAQGESFEEKKGEIEKKEKGESAECKDEKCSSSFCDSNLKLVVILLIGILIGILIKIPATKAITIGYDDYKVNNLKSDYVLLKDEDEIEAEVEKEGDAILTEGVGGGQVIEAEETCVEGEKAEGVVQVGGSCE